MEMADEQMARLKRQHRLMQANMKMYRRETQTVLRRQRVVISNLRDDLNEAELELNLISSGRNEKRRRNMETTLHRLATQERQLLQEISSERGTITDLEWQISKLMKELNKSGKCFGMAARGERQRTEHLAMEQAKARMENKLHTAQMSLNLLLANNKQLRSEIKQQLLFRRNFSAQHRQLLQKLTAQQKIEGAIVDQATRHYTRRDNINAEIARLIEVEQKENARYTNELSSMTRSLDHAQSLQALICAKIHAKGSIDTVTNSLVTTEELQPTAEEWSKYQQALQRIQFVLDRFQQMGVLKQFTTTDSLVKVATTEEQESEGEHGDEKITTGGFSDEEDCHARTSDPGALSSACASSTRGTDLERHASVSQPTRNTSRRAEPNVHSLPEDYRLIEEDNSALYDYISKLNGRLESEHQQLDKLNQETSSSSTADITCHRQQQSQLTQLQMKLDTAVEAVESASIRRDTAQLELTGVCDDVRLLLDMISPWATPVAKMSVGQDVTEMNLLFYMSLLKSAVQNVIDNYSRLLLSPSVDDPSPDDLDSALAGDLTEVDVTESGFSPGDTEGVSQMIASLQVDEAGGKAVDPLPVGSSKPKLSAGQVQSHEPRTVSAAQSRIDARRGRGNIQSMETTLQRTILTLPLPNDVSGKNEDSTVLSVEDAWKSTDEEKKE